jgi:benzoate 4-monooxygenase
MINYVLHHNPNVWGPDPDILNPNRWIDGRAKDNTRYLIPFSIGHRICIGRNVATIEIYKIVTTLLRKYRFHLVYPDEKQCLRSSGIGELNGPLFVRVSKREHGSS